MCVSAAYSYVMLREQLLAEDQFGQHRIYYASLILRWSKPECPLVSVKSY